MALLERSKLYQDVWSRPCTKIAAELGISSSALKRICTEMDIPTPVAGYWTRVQCGKQVSKDPLPKAKKETRLTWDVDLDNSKRQKTERVKKQKEVREVAEVVGTEDLPVITIAQDLENLHPLVKATRAQLRENWSNKPWGERKDRKRFDARVFENSLDRACLFLDAFARGVEAMGLRFRCNLDLPEARNPRRGNLRYHDQKTFPICWVEANCERVSFVLKEKRRREKVTDPVELKRLWGRAWEDVPTGILEFSINGGWVMGRKAAWIDGNGQRIESHLGQMVTLVPIAGEENRQQRLRWKEEQAREERRSEQKAWMDDVREKENKAIEVLSAQMGQHLRANDLRIFIESARTLYLRDHGQAPAENSPAGLWLRWAELRAEALDPLGHGFRPWNGKAFRQIPGLFPET
jgi:DNA-binding Lrp family transcriptional regulator